jgi:hypothetical protein
LPNARRCALRIAVVRAGGERNFVDGEKLRRVPFAGMTGFMP